MEYLKHGDTDGQLFLKQMWTCTVQLTHFIAVLKTNGKGLKGLCEHQMLRNQIQLYLVLNYMLVFQKDVTRNNIGHIQAFSCTL